jgi:probable F420-dependent oxidoreductase
MHIGIAAAFGDSPQRDIGFLRNYAVATEQLGFQSLWFPEHVVFFRNYDSQYPHKQGGETPWGDRVGLYDPLLICAVAATVTTRLRFGTTVLIVPERPALLTAKAIMTIDHIAPGRFEFGAGLGWSAEEYAALGIPWEDRAQRFDEYLDAIRIAWTADLAEYHGRTLDFRNVLLRPYPLTPGGPPILVGGNSKAAIRRALRYGDGWYGVYMNAGELRVSLQQIGEQLAALPQPRERPFILKACMPSALVAPRDEVLRAVESAAALGLHELVLHLPIRSKTMEADMAGWARDLGIRAA